MLCVVDFSATEAGNLHYCLKPFLCPVLGSPVPQGLLNVCEIKVRPPPHAQPSVCPDPTLGLIPAGGNPPRWDRGEHKFHLLLENIYIEKNIFPCHHPIKNMTVHALTVTPSLYTN